MLKISKGDCRFRNLFIENSIISTIIADTGERANAGLKITTQRNHLTAMGSICGTQKRNRCESQETYQQPTERENVETRRRCLVCIGQRELCTRWYPEPPGILGQKTDIALRIKELITQVHNDHSTLWCYEPFHLQLMWQSSYLLIDRLQHIVSLARVRGCK